GVDGADRLDPHGAGGSLGDVAERAGEKRAMHVLGIRMHGEHEHAGLGRSVAQAPRDLDAIRARHRDIDDRDIGISALGEAHRGLAVAEGAGDAHVRLRFEKPRHPVAHERVIVNEDELDHPAATSTVTRVPLPEEATRTAPPTAAARSRMTAMPHPGGAGSFAAAGARPRPLSSTTIVSCAPERASATRAREAAACLATLMSASCAMRKSASS